MILRGDCRERMAEMEENSVDAIVCDPPYELGFMGKKWDGSGIAYDQEVWRQAWRVLKPGGYILAFGGSRTYHRLACAIEDAGFEIRDCISWVYGSGFPKSLDVSKAIDRAAGAEREVIGQSEVWENNATGGRGGQYANGPALPADGSRKTVDITATDAARQWDGWGTALKPAHEPIVMARKPLSEKTVAANVLRWGCGAVNIDASRIGTEVIEQGRKGRNSAMANGVTLNVFGGQNYEKPDARGRWPANLILGHAPGCVRRGEKRVRGDNGGEGKFRNGDGWGMTKSGRHYTDPDGMETVADWDCVEGCPVKMISEQSGHLKSGGGSKTTPGDKISSSGWKEKRLKGPEYSPSEGTAARFFLQVDPDPAPLFYCTKVSQAERNRGLEGMALGTNRSSQNHHPTVKPLKLMRYLVRLVTPPGGTVLDPFAGSGTTLVAAKEEGFRYIGIELEPEYIEIAEARLAAAERPPATLDDF